MMDELSQYRSRVLCSTVEPPPIGRLPVIDPADAQNLAAYPQWHAYIQRSRDAQAAPAQKLWPAEKKNSPSEQNGRRGNRLRFGRYPL